MTDDKIARKSEFIALASQSGWTQARIAEVCEAKPGTISGIIKGKKFPSPRILSILRRGLELAGRKYPAGEEGVTFGETSDPRLREIKEADPAAFETVERVIDLAHRAVKGASSKVDLVARSAVGTMVAEIKDLRPKEESAPPGPVTYRRARSSRRQSAQPSTPPAPDPK